MFLTDLLELLVERLDLLVPRRVGGQQRLARVVRVAQLERGGAPLGGRGRVRLAARRRLRQRRAHLLVPLGHCTRPGALADRTGDCAERPHGPHRLAHTYVPALPVQPQHVVGGALQARGERPAVQLGERGVVAGQRARVVQRRLPARVRAGQRPLLAPATERRSVAGRVAGGACPRRDALVLLVLVALRGGARQLVERARVLVLEVGAAAAVVVQLARHAGRRLGARLQHARLLRELHADVCNSNYVEKDVNAHYVMRVFSS